MFPCVIGRKVLRMLACALLETVADFGIGWCVRVPSVRLLGASEIVEAARLSREKRGEKMEEAAAARMVYTLVKVEVWVRPEDGRCSHGDFRKQPTEPPAQRCAAALHSIAS